MRKLAKALILLASIGWTQWVHGLGLGDIEAYSALNQALEAEITLTSVRPGETDGLIVKLASEEAFAQAGVERPFYLTSLKFTLATKPNGTPYIQVTTDNPLREPFVNFLIDVDWPRGRLVREYTILLDPPVFATQQQTAPDFSAPAVSSVGTGIAGVGEPALIDRAAEAAGEFEFAYEDEAADTAQPVDQFATDQFQQGGFEEASPAASASLDDLPDIEVEGAAEEAAVAEELPLAAAEDPEFFPYEEVAPVEEAPVVTGIDALQEETLPEHDAAGVDTGDLPDIDIELDETLPYDEAATSALLAQFAAEDAVRGRPSRVQPSTPSVEPSSAGDEYAVQAGDTLYEIASQYKPADISINQAMLAILRQNPDAFIRDNINTVKKGFVLRIPDRSAMLAMSNAEALEEVKRHNALWREYRDQLAGAASTTRDAQAADTYQASRSDTTRTTGGELSLLSPGRDAEGSTRAAGQQAGEDAESGALYRDLQLAREQLAAERLEKTELQERLSELGEQLTTMERLITLKDEQLSALQQRLAALEAASGTTQSATTETPVEQEKPGLILSPDDAIDEPLLDDELEETAEPADEQAALESKPSLEERLTRDVDSGISLGETTPRATSPVEEEAPAVAAEERVADAPAVETPAAEQLATAPPETTREPTRPVTATVAETPKPPRYTGVVGFIYEKLPPPYNIMAADVLESPIGLGAVAAVLIIFLLLIASLFRSGGAEDKKAVKSKAAPVKEDTIKTAKPVKAPLGDRLKAMFAPLSGLFASGHKKPALLSVMAGSSANRHADDDLDEQNDVGEEEPDSFDETVMVAAAAVDSGKPAGAAKPAAKADLDKTAIGEAPIQQAEPEEEVADDTTAEADVYLAYGLFDQAEELLKQALASNPRKLEYKGKLLETYFAAGKQNDFEKLAAEVHAGLKGKPSRIWEKAIVMGKELAPANPLFSGGDSSLKVSDFAPAKPEMADLDLGETPGSTTPDIAFDEDTSSSTDFNLDFDVVTGSHEKEQFEETFIDSGSPGDKTMVEDSHLDTARDFQAGGEPSLVDEMDIDFNADELGLGADIDATLIDTGKGPGAGATEFEADVDLEGFDSISPEATVAMDMNFDLADESGSESDAFDIQGASDTDMDLGDIDDADADGINLSSAGDDLIADLDAGDLTAASVDTEFEISEEEDTIIDSELTDETFSGDSDMDEVSTKLDLAKAYMEMGDFDGASSTLEEVLAEGDEAQRRQAEEMLDQIS